VGSRDRCALCAVCGNCATGPAFAWKDRRAVSSGPTIARYIQPLLRSTVPTVMGQRWPACAAPPFIWRMAASRHEGRSGSRGGTGERTRGGPGVHAGGTRARAPRGRGDAADAQTVVQGSDAAGRARRHSRGGGRRPRRGDSAGRRRVGAIASFFLGLAFGFQGGWGHAAVAWSLAGATLGFLRYNFHPASVFMGDAGSLFLGSMLAGLVVTLPGAVSTNLVSVLFVPLVIVAVPLLDTTLVTVTRVLAGQPISEGGLDHSTYRLIALGLNERQVAVLLYALAAAGGLIALLLTRLDRWLGVLVGTAFLVVI